MKELSIEEKAKAYDELKVKAQELTEDGYIDKLALLDLFPELKESEDERIRKWCISHFKECINVIKDNDEYKEYLSNKVIAWLEKQGVQKPANKVESNKKFTPIESALKDLICDVDNSYTIEQVRRFLFEYGYKDKILNAAQEEMQKPVWSEEDEDYINDLIKYFLQNEKLENTKEDIVIWLKSLKDRYTWKPSDEQMKALDRAQAELCSTEYNKPICDLIDALNKLKE